MLLEIVIYGKAYVYCKQGFLPFLSGFLNLEKPAILVHTKSMVLTRLTEVWTGNLVFLY